MYTAVVLGSHDSVRLRQKLESLAGWRGEGFVFRAPQGYSLPHHLTLNMGRFDSDLNDPKLLGENVPITIQGFCWCNHLGVCAALVSCKAKSKNAQPHITMCVRPGVKPVASNQLDWGQAVLLDDPMTLYGTVLECD